MHTKIENSSETKDLCILLSARPIYSCEMRVMGIYFPNIFCTISGVNRFYKLV